MAVGLAPAVQPYLDFRVVAHDAYDPERVALVGPDRGSGVIVVGSVLVDLGRAKLDAALSTSGAWSDEDLLPTRAVLERVEYVTVGR